MSVRLPGVKNGKRIGMKLNIVANAVEEINETNQYTISTSIIPRVSTF